MNPPQAAVASCGAVTALGFGTEAIAPPLRENRSGLRLCPRLKDRGYQTQIAGWVPDNDDEADRAESDPSLAEARLSGFADAALHEATRASRALLQSIPSDRLGLVLSTAKSDVDALARCVRGQACSPRARRHILAGPLAADLAAAHGVGGDVESVSAACISGLMAVQHAAERIRRGEADAVLAIGVEVLSHFVLSGFSSLKSLDPGGCRPFDRGRLGLSLGEGAGALVLARRDLLPGPAWVVAGWGTSNDANHLTGPSRDGSGLALAVVRALRKAGVAPGEVDYINAHGTGTKYNDNMESLALRAVFGDAPPPVSSVKGMLGHTMGAAGILETIVTLIAAQEGILPGTPRLQDPDPVAPASLVASPHRFDRMRTFLKINAGFGGMNAAVVLQLQSSPSTS